MGEKTLLTYFHHHCPVNADAPWMCCHQRPGIAITATLLWPPKQHHFNFVTAIALTALIFSLVRQLPMILLRDQFTLTHVGTLYCFIVGAPKNNYPPCQLTQWNQYTLIHVHPI